MISHLYSQTWKFMRHTMWTNTLTNLLWVVLAHLLADYPLQGDFLAKAKETSLFYLCVHAIMYSLILGLSFNLMGAFALWKIPILVLFHITVDRISIEKRIGKPIDQALHVSLAVLLYLC